MQQRRMLRSMVAAGAILIAQFSGCTLSTNGTSEPPGGTAGSAGNGLSGQGGTTSSNQGGYAGVAGNDASLGGEGGSIDVKDASPKDAQNEVLSNLGGSSGQGGIHSGGAGGVTTGGAAGASAQGGAGGIAPAGAAGTAGTADPPDGASDDVTIVADVVLPDADDGAAGAAGTVNADSGKVCALSLPNEPACNTCMNLRCLSECDECAADTDCSQYANCLVGCSDNPCKEGCQKKFKNGEGKLKALAGDDSCLDVKCSNECPSSVTTTPTGCSLSSAPLSRNGSVGVLVLLTFGLLGRKRRNQQIL